MELDEYEELGRKYYHFLCQEKSISESMRCLQMLIEQRIMTFAYTNKIIIVSDGGPADFKCTEWQVQLLQLSGKLSRNIIHLILAAYHGSGDPDAAKSHAQKKIQSIAASKVLNMSDLPEIINTVKSAVCHVADVVCGAYPDPVPCQTLNGITEYFHFEYEPSASKIKAWKQSSIIQNRYDASWIVASPAPPNRYRQYRPNK
jgi:hypothetical protein